MRRKKFAVQKHVAMAREISAMRIKTSSSEFAVELRRQIDTNYFSHMWVRRSQSLPPRVQALRCILGLGYEQWLIQAFHGKIHQSQILCYVPASKQAVGPPM